MTQEPPLFETSSTHLDEVLRGGGAAHPAVVELALARYGTEAVYVQVPAHGDRAGYVATALARQCGDRALAAVSESMDRTLDAEAWFAALVPHLRDRLAIVEVAEPGPPELSEVLTLLPDPRFLRGSDPARRVLRLRTAPSAIDAMLTPRPVDRWKWDVLWREVGADPTRYGLAVSAALCLDRLPAPEVLRDAVRLAETLWRELPGELADLLGLLRVHGRPIARTQMQALGLVEPSVVAEALDGHLLELRGDQYVVAPALMAVPLALPSGLTSLRHRRWAEAFERAAKDDAPEVDRTTAILEAHRHFAAVPDSERALTFARYGSGVLLAMAVEQSRSGDPVGAAATYEFVEAMHARLPRVEPHLRAYVRHYLHYNRYKGAREPIVATLGGYGDAVADWPENALFQARRVRALFVAGREATALDALGAAWRSVPDRAESARYLLDRSVQKLLRRGLPVAALVVAGCAPEGLALTDAHARALSDRLARGWLASRVWSLDAEAVSLPAPTCCTLASSSEAWWGVIGDTRRSGRTPLEAWGAVVRAVRFTQLADHWQRETAHFSARARKFAHPAYQTILGMGRAAVPEILGRIAAGRRGHWDEALAALTGEQPPLPPLPPGSVTLSDVQDAWVAWGRQHGLVGEPDGPDVA